MMTLSMNIISMETCTFLFSSLHYVSVGRMKMLTNTTFENTDVLRIPFLKAPPGHVGCELEHLPLSFTVNKTDFYRKPGLLVNKM